MEGVSGAADDAIAEVEVTPSGYGLHWEKLDQDFTVPGLVAGVFGSKKWMSQIAAQMGQRDSNTTSPAKAAASRVNGRKGGRPKTAAKRAAKVEATQ